MKTASAKAKGRRLARWLADEIVRRFEGLQPDDVRVTGSGATGEDVTLSPAARNHVNFQFECKNRKSFSICRDFDQAVSHGRREPALVIKENRSEPLVLIRATTFFDLLQGQNNNNESERRQSGN